MSILFCHVFFPNIFHSSLAPSAIITQSSLLIVNDFFFNEKMRTFPNELSRFPFYCHLKSFLSKFIVSFLNSLREKKQLFLMIILYVLPTMPIFYRLLHGIVPVF